MTKKRLTRFLLLALALLIFPFANLSFTAKAATPDHTTKALVGVEFIFEVSNEKIKTASVGVVDITLQKNGGEVKTVFDAGSDCDDEYTVAYTQGSATANAKVKATVYDVGTYLFTVKVSVESVEYSHVEQVNVTSNVNEFNLPSYNLDATLLEEYENKVVENTFIKDTSPKQNLRINDDYTVPSIEKLIVSDLLPYTKYRRTVYYSAPTSNSYSSASASGTADLSFKISKLGEYRFYVVLDADKIDGKDFDLNTSFLEERIDGWYKIFKKGTQTQVYASTSNGIDYTYFEDEELLEKCADTQEYDSVKIIPIFSFEIVNNAGPSVKITSSYQENGYIGLEYKVKSITVGGSDIHTVYTLQYNANSKEENDAGWATAEEEYDDTKNSFTPTKQGYYRVKVYVVDGDGIPAEGVTKVITVTEKYTNVDYKTSFSDWVSVNTMPFIFLCISGACLIAIIVLLVLPNGKKKDSEIADGEDL